MFHHIKGIVWLCVYPTSGWGFTRCAWLTIARARQKPTRGPAQIQDILQWQQSYNSNSIPQQQEEASGELVVRDEGEAGVIHLTRELLLEAKESTDGLPVEIGTFTTAIH
jgi:hypothetical protein